MAPRSRWRVRSARWCRRSGAGAVWVGLDRLLQEQALPIDRERPETRSAPPAQRQRIGDRASELHLNRHREGATTRIGNTWLPAAPGTSICVIGDRKWGIGIEQVLNTGSHLQLLGDVHTD